MSEPIERLSKFTPDSSGLDRDRLLFEAGRASARPNRRWRALCMGLTASQLLTLGLWCWPRPVTPPATSDPGVPMVNVSPWPAPAAEASSIGRLREQALATEGNLPSSGIVERRHVRAAHACAGGARFVVSLIAEPLRRTAMSRVLLAWAALLTLPFPTRAGEGPEPTETVIRMTVSPAAEPKPALYYQLLPELREMNPGNPVPAYMKCFMEQNNFWFNKDVVEEREKWQTMPLKDLPVHLLKTDSYGKGRGPLGQADYAARLETVDWQVLLPLRRDGIHLLVPELQPMRTLAGALRVRGRLELADKRYGDAIVTLKTMFALARHLGEHPTLVGGLVGTAVASLAVETLDELIAQQGIPTSTGR